MNLLDTYFKSGAVVCPYARTTQITYFNDKDFHNASQHSPWLHVVASERVAVVCATIVRHTFDEAKNWCELFYERIASSFSHGYKPDRHLPFLEIGETRIYTIGMGPQYPTSHPRYAPALCLVSVNEEEIKNVPFIKRDPIRRAAAERMGGVYNPDEVWLDLNPRTKEI